MSETGVVKFGCEHLVEVLPPFSETEELNECRRALVEKGLVGVDSHGIGFGNLSVRDGLTSDFYITGSQTGRLTQLGREHFSKVTAWDFERNWIRCQGLEVASSESLTHAALYELDRNIRAILHCHSAEMWRRMLDVFPTTASEIEYGTSAMAKEVRRLFETTEVRTRKIFLTAGHEDGVFAFGENLSEALYVLTRGAQL